MNKKKIKGKKKTFFTTFDVITDNRSLSRGSVFPLQVYGGGGTWDEQIFEATGWSFLGSGGNVAADGRTQIVGGGPHREIVGDFFLEIGHHQPGGRHFLFDLFAEGFVLLRRFVGDHVAADDAVGVLRGVPVHFQTVHCDVAESAIIPQSIPLVIFNINFCEINRINW